MRSKGMNIQLFAESEEEVIDTEDKTIGGGYDDEADYEEDYAEETDEYDFDDEAGDAESNEEDNPSTGDANETIDGEDGENEYDARALMREAYERGLREGRVKSMINKTNPYTGEAIKDEADIFVFEQMTEMEKLGLDPITDYPKYLAEKRRAEIESSRSLIETTKKRQSDLMEFTAKYPDVELDKIFSDEDFKRYADGKLGVRSLTEIYDGFNVFSSRLDNKAATMAQRLTAKQKSSPGSLTGKVNSKKSIDSMTDEEFEAIRVKALRGEYVNI